MRARVWVALTAVYIAWGSTYLAIRFAVETIPPFLMAGVRFLVSAVILFIWRRSDGDALPTARQWRAAIVVGVLLLLGGNGLLSWSEQYVPSGVAALIVGSSPLWMVLMNAVRPGGLRPDLLTILGVLVGLVGTAILVGGPGSPGGSLATLPLGVAAVLAASVFWSLGSVVSHSADMPASASLSTSIQMFAGAAALFLVGAWTGEWARLSPAAVSTRSFLALGYLIVFGSLIGFVAYGWLLRNAPLSLVSTYAYVNPVVAILLGAWIGGEQLNARVVLAAAVIIGSVILINASRRGRDAQNARAAAKLGRSAT